MLKNNIQDESVIKTDTDNKNSMDNITLNATEIRSTCYDMAFEANNILF